MDSASGHHPEDSLVIFSEGDDSVSEPQGENNKCQINPDSRALSCYDNVICLSQNPRSRVTPMMSLLPEPKTKAGPFCPSETKAVLEQKVEDEN